MPSWSKIGNIKGPTGDKGNPGSSGADGAPGAAGKDGNPGSKGADGCAVSLRHCRSQRLGRQGH